MTNPTLAREAARETDGRFGAQVNSAPDITLEAPAPAFIEWEAEWTRVPDSESNFQTYDDALSAAGGDTHKVWTLIDGDYPAGNKVWKFVLDGDEEIVTAETEEDAREIVATIYAERFGDDPDLGGVDPEEGIDEDAPFLEGAYFGGDDPLDEAAWVRAPDSYAVTGFHRVNAFGFVVSEEPWQEQHENKEYAW